MNIPCQGSAFLGLAARLQPVHVDVDHSPRAKHRLRQAGVILGQQLRPIELGRVNSIPEVVVLEMGSTIPQCGSKSMSAAIVKCSNQRSSCGTHTHRSTHHVQDALHGLWRCRTIVVVDLTGRSGSRGGEDNIVGTCY